MGLQNEGVQRGFDVLGKKAKEETEGVFPIVPIHAMLMDKNWLSSCRTEELESFSEYCKLQMSANIKMARDEKGYILGNRNQKPFDYYADARRVLLTEIGRRFDEKFQPSIPLT